jgi:hypothetical protein
MVLHYLSGFNPQLDQQKKFLWADLGSYISHMSGSFSFFFHEMNMDLSLFEEGSSSESDRHIML